MTQENVEPKFKQTENYSFDDFDSALTKSVRIGAELKMDLADRNDGWGLRPVDDQKNKIRIRRHAGPNSPETFSVHLFQRP